MMLRIQFSHQKLRTQSCSFQSKLMLANWNIWCRNPELNQRPLDRMPQIDVKSKIVETASKEPVAKCLLLKLMSKFYDPLSLFTPVTVIMKILFQDTWLNEIKWDELLPPAAA
ncbi:hypothetical protein TNCV_402931 [Trichonephila clavipes]|nr:hypothetical protein TNCV_402931 [Trichonephila clavipes]